MHSRIKNKRKQTQKNQTVQQEILAVEKRLQQSLSQLSNLHKLYDEKNTQTFKALAQNNTEIHKNNTVVVYRQEILNLLLQHQSLLNDEFKYFFVDLLALDWVKPLNIQSFDYSKIFHHFIRSQDKFSLIFNQLDRQSVEILKFTLVYQIIEPLLFPGNSIYTKETHLSDLEKFNMFFKHPLDIYRDQVDDSPREQYINDFIDLREGMHVIDGGGFDGDTAEVFSGLVGETGVIYSFEPLEESYEKLISRNLANVVCIQKGLYSKSGTVNFDAREDYRASGSTVCDEGADSIPVVSIDEFVEENNISRIDYIKFDIEGSELAALEGARKTMARDLPMLAICIYHNSGKDLIDVPYYLMTHYGGQYEFLVQHHSITVNETVIYARKKA